MKSFYYRTRRELERWLVEGGEGMREEYALVSRLVLKLNQGACAAGHRVDNRHCCKLAEMTALEQNF
jgi:hypothetical protein